jgi:type IV pilus assembly protein PilC
MAYPAFVVGFIVLIVIVLMTLIIPRFSLMFEEFNGELPAFTRGFMAVYDVIVSNALHILIVTAAAVMGLIFYKKTATKSFASLCYRSPYSERLF